MLRFKNLGSGSAGNATLIHASSGTGAGTTVLVDCGLGIRALERRAAEAGVLARKHRIPVWMSAGTHQGLREGDFEGLLHIAVHGQPIVVGDLRLHPFDVPHDAGEPLQLHCTDGDARLGILTDLGHVPPEVIEQLAGCGTVLLECNHDAEMLASGPYAVAAEAARALQASGLRQVVAAHLSRQNNRPELARRALSEALGWDEAAIHVADQDTGTGWLRA